MLNQNKYFIKNRNNEKRDVSSTIAATFSGKCIHCSNALYSAKNSSQRCSEKRDVFKNFAKLTGKQPRQRLFFSKVAGLIPATSLKEKLCYRRFPVNFAKF